MSSELRSPFDLAPAEKLRLVQALWDDLASQPESIPLDEAALDEAERRATRLQADPESRITWDELRKRLAARNGS